MFRFMLLLLGMIASSLFRPGEAAPDPADPAEPQDDKAYKRLVFATKEEADEHYNEVFADRDQRMRKTIREDVTNELLERLGMDDVDEVAAVFEEAQALQGADQTEAEKEKKRADRLAEKVKKLEGERTELADVQGRTANLEKMLKGQLRSKMEQVDEPYRELLEDKTVEEQAAWFEKNADKLDAKPTDQNNDEPADDKRAWKVAGSPATGRPAQGGPDKEKDKEAQQEQRTLGISRI